MGLLPEFQRPSKPDETVRLREATVSDAIDFSDVDGDHEEKATTLFLERVQDKATCSNPSKWTAEDRRFALFWYWLHTAKDLEVPMTFECDHCGEKHTVLVGMSKIAEEYQPISGKPERDLLFDGTPIIVSPLDGDAMTEIENMRINRDGAIEEHGENSGPARQYETKLRMLSFLRSISIDGKSKEDTEHWLLGLTTTEFAALFGRVSEAISSMKHGLPSTVEDFRIMLITPPIQCEVKKEDKDATTRLTFPFRAFNYIPRI